MNKYYNGDELDARHYNFNFVCGDRFGGKSTWVQKKIIKRAIRTNGKRKFAVLVRYDLDIDTLCRTYFQNTMEMFYPSFKLIYEAKKFYLTLNDDSINFEPVLVGYGFALNKASKMKSTSYPDIDIMVLEEFMNIEGKYIKSKAEPELEVELLISLFATIARGGGKQYRDNVKVYLISNNFYLDNPYFKYYDLISDIVNNPTKRFYEKKGDIENGIPSCIVEMTHNNLRLSVGRGDVNKGSKFIDMQNELNIIKKPNVKAALLQLSLDNREFLNVSIYNNSYLIHTNGNKIRNDCRVFSCSTIKRQGIINIKELKGEYLWKSIIQELNNNRLFFDRLESYILLNNILVAAGSAGKT